MVKIKQALLEQDKFIVLPVVLALIAGSVVFAEIVGALLPTMSQFTAILVRLALTLMAAAALGILAATRKAKAQIVAPPAEAPAVQGVEVAGAACDTFRCAVCISEKLSYFRIFSGALKDDTQSVIADTEQNAVALMNQLRIVETGMEGLLQFITYSNDGVVQIIDSTETQLSRSRSLIDEFSEKRVRDAVSVQDAMDGISTVVESLGQMVQVVRGIARQTRMLALNATIEAVRAGESGKGFAIVASEVKALSLQSDHAAVQIGEGIEKLEKAVQDSLHTIVGDRIAKEESGFAVISDAVGDLTDNLQRLISHQRDTLTKVQQENERLAEPIMQMIGSIQFQDVVKRRLQALVQAFDQITSTINESVLQVSSMPDISLEEMNSLIREKLDGMVNSCLDELNVGRSTNSAGAQTQGAAIELF